MNQEEQRTYSIYAIRCRDTGRVYIGATCDVERRIRQHLDELGRHAKIKKSNVHKQISGQEWQDDYDTYGEESFDFYVIETGIKYEDRLRREDHYISELNTCDKRYGYNTKRSVKRKQSDLVIIKGLPPRDYSVAEQQSD